MRPSAPAPAPVVAKPAEAWIAQSGGRVRCVDDPLGRTESGGSHRQGGPHAFVVQGRQPHLTCVPPCRKAWAEELVARRQRQQEQDGKEQPEQTGAGATAAAADVAAAGDNGAEGAGADEAEQLAKRARVEG